MPRSSLQKHLIGDLTQMMFKYCINDSIIIDILSKVIIHDSFEREEQNQFNPQETAFLTYCSYHPKNLELLHDRALNDPGRPTPHLGTRTGGQRLISLCSMGIEQHHSQIAIVRL